jgi:hypothetical protein
MSCWWTSEKLKLKCRELFQMDPWSRILERTPKDASLSIVNAS